MKRWTEYVAMIFLWLTAATAWAGGSGFNLVVVVNQQSTNSVILGNEYCEQRGVPPDQVLRLTNWFGGSISWSRADFETKLRDPLLAMLVERGLTNQVDYVLLSMDIPYRVVDTDNSQNSTTAALFYGFKPDTISPDPNYPSCSLPGSSSNSYAFSERPFRLALPDTAPTNSFLAMMLTGTSRAGAEAVLKSGRRSDSSFPTQTVYLAKTSDVARNVRFVEFDNAIFDARLRGGLTLLRTNLDATGMTNAMGLLTGLVNLSLTPGAFVPGAMGDSLTSFAGDILENSGQTSLLAFLEAGAAGSYGTVVEPCNYLQKFPSPLDYFYQQRGFSVLEAYYQSLQNPYQGLLVGEPLAAPFARPGTADWNSLTNDSVLSGWAPLSLTFTAAVTNLPLSQVDLFVDGHWMQTMTNITPTAGNVLSVTLNGVHIDYSIPPGADLMAAASGLAAALNAQTNQTQVQAYLAGDRIALHSLDPARLDNGIAVQAQTSAGVGPGLTTWINAAQPAFLDTLAQGYRYFFVTNLIQAGDWLRLSVTKTNGSIWSVGVTNTSANAQPAQLVLALMNLVNAQLEWQTPDGVYAADSINYGVSGIAAADFYLYARSAGWPAAQIEVELSASPGLLVTPSVAGRLEDNLADLQPRNHLYLSAGLISLSLNCTLDTTLLPDGFHELTAVCYEGTSVRTQTRVARRVEIQNTSLSATISPSLLGTNVTLDAPLNIAIAANTTNVSRIELFSTSGSLGAVSNQPSAVFPVPSGMLGLGLHPFYAKVTGANGEQYRTRTAWIRFIPSFRMSITAGGRSIIWPSQPGQRYDILATTNLGEPFLLSESVTASNSVTEWTIPGSGTAGFFRVRVAP